MSEQNNFRTGQGFQVNERPIRMCDSAEALRAEDEGFEPSKGCPLHAFQACALGRYANPPEGANSIGAHNYDYARSLVRRYRTELPQGRNAARVGPLWRVCEGS